MQAIDLKLEQNKMKLEEIKKFINGKVTYDKFGGQYLWINEPKGGQQMLAELRGWGHIQNMFKSREDAFGFQDAVGDFIAEAINEKINGTIEQQKAEIERLKAVLQESFSVWEKVDEYARKHPEIKLGESVNKHALMLMKRGDEANQRGDKLKGVARNVLKEATKVYCHYNEIIKNKNESMDFKTLKELDAALSEYESTKVKPVDSNDYDITKEE